MVWWIKHDCKIYNYVLQSTWLCLVDCNRYSSGNIEIYHQIFRLVNFTFTVRLLLVHDLKALSRHELNYSKLKRPISGSVAPLCGVNLMASETIMLLIILYYEGSAFPKGNTLSTSKSQISWANSDIGTLHCVILDQKWHWFNTVTNNIKTKRQSYPVADKRYLHRNQP